MGTGPSESVEKSVVLPALDRLSNSVTREVACDIGADLLCGLDVSITRRAEAGTLPRQPATVQRRGELRIELQRRIEVVHRVGNLAELQVDEPAAIERVDEVWAQL